MRGEEWLDFYTAAQEIQQRLGMSRGGAQKTLRELCGTGEVRSQKQPYTMVNREPQTEGPTERIQPSEWRGLEVDLMTDADGCKYLVEVSENDFRHWLDQEGSPERQSGPRPRDLGKQAVKALWPKGVPAYLSNTDIEKAVVEWLKTKGLKVPSRETILREAGRRQRN
jgi:hypothetical protein